VRTRAHQGGTVYPVRSLILAHRGLRARLAARRQSGRALFSVEFAEERGGRRDKTIILGPCHRRMRSRRAPPSRPASLRPAEPPGRAPRRTARPCSPARRIQSSGTIGKTVEAIAYFIRLLSVQEGGSGSGDRQCPADPGISCRTPSALPKVGRASAPALPRQRQIGEGRFYATAMLLSRPYSSRGRNNYRTASR